MKRFSRLQITARALTGAVFVVFAATWPALSTEIGSVTAANQRIDGTPPGQEARILQLGNRVFADETIVSSEIGSGQFVFLDQTTLTVSPGSEIVLDRYVFDPEGGTGEVALTLTKGVLRFIGGKITKSGEATVQTPHATIGIRGGIVAITVGQEGTNAVFLAGANMCVLGKRREICITRPGGMATVRASSSEDSSGDAEGTADAPASNEESADSTTSGASAVPASDVGEPVYVGVASAEQIGLIYSSTDTGGDGGVTRPMEPEIVASASSSAGMAVVGAEAPGAPSQPPVSTKGNEQQPDPVDSQSDSDATTEARSEPETSVAENPPEVIVDDFIGGIKSDISALGTSGQAMFTGTWTAAFNQTDINGTTQFEKSGPAILTYDFGDREGAATIAQVWFDPINKIEHAFTGRITEADAAPGEHFGGSLGYTGTFSEVGSLNGSFFTNRSDTSALTAGTFDFTFSPSSGVTQTGVGDFQADKLD